METSHLPVSDRSRSVHVPRAETDSLLLTEWKTAVRTAPPFLSAEFFLHTAALIHSQPLVAVGRDQGGSAFLPLCRRGRELRALRSEQSPRFDVAGDPDALPALWDEMLCRPTWDVVVLRSVPVLSPLVRDLPRMARRSGCEVVIQPVGRTPFLSLDELDSVFSRKLRGELHRCRRELGEIRLERITHYDRRALDAAFELEASHVRQDGGTAIAGDPYLRHFYRAIARDFAQQGRFALSFLRVGERRVAVQFAAEDRDTYYLMKRGCAADMARFEVCRMLVQLVALDARQRGLSRLEFLGSEEEWRRRTSGSLPHAELRIYRRSIRGRIRHTIAERLVPAAGGTAAAIRSIRAGLRGAAAE